MTILVGATKGVGVAENVNNAEDDGAGMNEGHVTGDGDA